jgi:hypothetical protein
VKWDIILNVNRYALFFPSHFFPLTHVCVFKFDLVPKTNQDPGNNDLDSGR